MYDDENLGFYETAFIQSPISSTNLWKNNRRKTKLLFIAVDVDEKN